MTTLPAANYMNDNARTQGEMKTAFEDLRQFIEDLHGVDSTAGPTRKNALMNGDFRVPQRGTSFTSATTPANNDDTYLLDRVLLLSDGNDIVDVSQENSVVPSGAYAAIALDVETANKKFGICFILEARDSKALAGQKVSLSFKARTTGAISIDHLRAAVASWTGTADVVTSQLVAGGAWGAAGANPTLATSWAFDNTPASLATLTTAFQTFTIENISVASGANNVAVFIWIDDVTTTITEILYIGDVQLELGSIATDFERRPFAGELALCKRYFEKLDFSSVSTELVAGGYLDDTNTGFFSLFFAEKRAAPSITSSVAATFIILWAGANQTGTAITFAFIGQKTARLALDVGATPFTAGEGAFCLRDATDTTFIDLDSEL